MIVVYAAHQTEKIHPLRFLSYPNPGLMELSKCFCGRARIPTISKVNGAGSLPTAISCVLRGNGRGLLLMRVISSGRARRATVFPPTVSVMPRMRTVAPVIGADARLDVDRLLLSGDLEIGVQAECLARRQSERSKLRLLEAGCGDCQRVSAHIEVYELVITSGVRNGRLILTYSGIRELHNCVRNNCARRFLDGAQDGSESGLSVRIR